MSPVRRKEFSSKHPLAEQQFETDGLNLFLQKAGALINITQEGQMALEILKPYLSRIEHDEEGLPIKLYPFTRRGKPNEPRLAIIDPEASLGRPVLVNTGIPVGVNAERYKSGESIDELKFDYDLTQEQIEEALRCELALRQAA